MKSLFIAFCLLVSINTFAQKPVSYVGVVESKESKEELYNRARRWFNGTFRDSKAVLTIQDKENGELAGNGNYRFYSDTFWGRDGTKGWIRFKISILTKDGKYKYELSEFTHEGNPLNTLNLSFGLITEDIDCPVHLPSQRKKWEDKLWHEIKTDIRIEAMATIESLKQAMNKSTDF